MAGGIHTGTVFRRMLPVAASLVLLAFHSAVAQTNSRYESFLFGVCYYPEQWPESYWEADARRMKECGVNTVRIGEFGWTLMEPRDGKFDLSLFDRAIATMGRQGIKVIFGTPTATPPKWLTQKHPEVLHVFETGRPADDQSRRHYCYNSPVYRRYSRRIVEELVRHYRGNTNIIGWQIDNEINNENPQCFSPSCRNAFQQWLRTKYGTLDALNTRWGTVVWSQLYSDWDQIGLPFRTPAYHNPGLMLDFRRFTSDSATSYMHEQLDILRRNRPNDFVTHNGVFRYVNYYQFSRELDLHAHDNYPTFEETPRFSTAASLTLSRSFNGRMMIMEQLTGPAGQTYMLRSPRPGEMRLWTMQTVAHGAEGVLHFRWRTAHRGAEEYWFGVLDADNVPRARFEEFTQEGRELQKLGPKIIGSKIESSIAIIKDFEADWAFDHQFLTKEVNVGVAQNQLFQAASELRQNLDFVRPDADLSRYKLIFASQLVLMDETLASRLRQFVEQGGTLVMSAHSALKDRDNALTDATIPIRLTNLFGIELDSFQTYQPPSSSHNAVRFDGGPAVPVHVFAEVLRPTAARVVGRWQGDYLKDMPAATERTLGKGKAVYYGSLFNLDSARYLMKRYSQEIGLKPMLTDVAEQIEVTRRTKGDTDFFFLLNHNDTPAEAAVGDGFVDAFTGEASPAKITLGAFGYRVLSRERSTRQ